MGSGKRKLSRKVKRTIRKALSGVCMASALIVALVPARPTKGYSTMPDDKVTAYDYTYGVVDTGADDLPLSLDGIDLSKFKPTQTINDSDVFKTYYVRRESQGNYEYGWQFKAYQDNYNGQNFGIICDYNSTYETELLEINKYLPTEYVTVSEDEFNSFYDAFLTAKENETSGSPNRVTIDSKNYKFYYEMNSFANSIVDGSDEYFIKKYFAAQYNAYKTDYDIWYAKKTAYAQYKAWEDAGSEGNPPNTQSTDPGDIEPLKVYVCDMSPNDMNLLKRTYFCEVNQKYNTSSLVLKGYVLVSAYDYTVPTTGTTTPKVYLAQGEPNVDFDGGTGSGTISNNDSLGFYVKSKTSIIAIGTQAFSDVQKVNRMKLSGDIAFIGDEAFLNSYVKGIEFSNIKEIGNRAFKNCSQLANITFGSGTTLIGTEAFYGCSMLSSLEFPYSIKEIGPGAFAQCTSLASIDMSSIGQADCKLDGFAFYNNKALNTITFSDKITTMGDACFACSEGATGSLRDIVLPDNLSNIGDFLVAGRGNLKTLTMPVNLGRLSNPTITLPEHMLWNCFNMESVQFPDDGMGSCGYIDFLNCPTIFSTITNQSFYVQGPGKNANNGIAQPRRSTWGKLSNGTSIDDGARQVPYVYIDEAGNKQYEVSDGTYILVVDPNGVLQACAFDPTATVTDIEMVIPETVGSTKVTGISSECFNNDTLREHMTKLTIKDNTISDIAAGAFKDYTKLEEVYIGDSVTSIGDSAFEGCTSLEYIKFKTPKGGYSSFPLSNIGTNALSTKSKSLIIEGDIDENYGPFAWAMQKDNFVDPQNGVRVCYKSGYPAYQTVIIDNRNGYATLLDYLHYDQIDAYAREMKIVTDTVHPSVIERYENQGKEVEDASGNIYVYSINAAEENLVKAALNITVPSGIESIDAYGYINNVSPVGEGYDELNSNSNNVNAYLKTSPYYLAYKGDPILKKDGGLFRNFYGTQPAGTDGIREYPSGNTKELEDRGNDRILSVKFNSVKYLPDYAFESCENLTSLDLGSSLDEMGVAPFTGCRNLTGIGSTSDKFKCENGIVYSTNSDGTYDIVEVLSARGILVGGNKVAVGDKDPLLANVSEILPGAFENCDGITNVDFSGMEKITEIPDKCFKDCDDLHQVILPENIKAIGHEAFAGCMEGINLYCYGKEVYLPTDAFGSNSNGNLVNKKNVISYSDSAVRRAAADIGADVSETLDDKVKILFYNYDGEQIGDTIFVAKGSSIPYDKIPDDPVRAGYTFTGWKPTLKGRTFEEDTLVIATYELSSTTDPSGNNQGSTSGNNSGNGNGSGNGSGSTSGNNTQFYTLTVTNGNGSGSYAAGATVIITCTNPPSGQVFDKWVPTTDDLGIASVNVAATTLKMPAHEASVTATFKKAPSNSSGSGGGGSTSGNNSGNKNNGTTVFITKPGVSNTSLASAQVSGSSDNYVIRISETAQATAAVEKALTNEYGSLDNVRYSAMDISLYDASGVNRITNYSGLSITITMPIPDVMTQYAGNNKVAGVVNEKLDKLKPKFTSIDGVPCVTFTATHFSPYTIYVNTANLSGEPVTIDGSPKTGDGIHPKWFLVAGLVAISIALFFMKDKKPVPKRSIA
ncbi:Leucine rich repeat-containing protein [Lachnospiraceae bacterium YSD2013]|nr:Leucine rich repeat-containing protein [Lachnospiraceae bacterium YSD2013]